MPRTKRPARQSVKVPQADDVLTKIDKIVAEQKMAVDDWVSNEIKGLDISFKILLGSMRQEDLKKTIGQLKTELYIKDISSRTTQQSSRSASRDDGIPVATSRPPSSRRRSRSADTTHRAPPSTTTKYVGDAGRRRSRSVYRTPAVNKMGHGSYPAITPKVAPQTPLTVLRQPRHGEMVVSMSGSPVMVPTYSSMQSDEVANCNIKLLDGTMLSLQPKHLRQSQVYIPYALMNKNMLSQLKTLTDNLEKVVKLGEKNIKQ